MGRGGRGRGRWNVALTVEDGDSVEGEGGKWQHVEDVWVRMRRRHGDEVKDGGVQERGGDGGRW